MPPDQKIAGMRARLDPAAVAAVIAAPQIPATPAPSDPDMDHLAFENAVYRYAAEWLSSHSNEAATASPFMLVFSRSIPSDLAMLSAAGHTSAKKYDAFRSQKMNDVTGCVIFATMNLEQAIVVSVQTVVDTQTLFDLISNIACGDRAVAALEPAHSNLIVRKPGGASQSMAVKQPGYGPLWTLDQLETGIETFHNDFTRTPSGVLEQWSSPKKGITGEKLEIRISKFLAYELDRNFARGSVMAEGQTSSGRMDIFIAPNVVDVGATVLEVKVLRSNSGTRKLSANFNTKWAQKGVIQAHLYRQDKQAAAAYLLCFDAREIDKDIPAVEQFAATQQVTSKRYFMYRASEDLQQVLLSRLAPAASAAGGAAKSH
jgi:hypothetical protein